MHRTTARRGCLTRKRLPLPSYPQIGEEAGTGAVYIKGAAEQYVTSPDEMFGIMQAGGGTEGGDRVGGQSRGCCSRDTDLPPPQSPTSAARSTAPSWRRA